MPKLYTDFDYESFPPADLDLDMHWIQLPRAVHLEKRKAREAVHHDVVKSVYKHVNEFRGWANPYPPVFADYPPNPSPAKPLAHDHRSSEKIDFGPTWEG